MRGGSTPPLATELLTITINKMAKLTEQQQNEMAERNRNIAERYCNLMEQQPFSSASRIIQYLAGQYDLTAQSIGRILREQGIETTTKPLNKVEL
jgi:predicted metal-dependent phosphoesterase TrpH